MFRKFTNTKLEIGATLLKQQLESVLTSLFLNI